jgi:hypothetical protein
MIQASHRRHNPRTTAVNIHHQSSQPWESLAPRPCAGGAAVQGPRVTQRDELGKHAHRSQENRRPGGASHKITGSGQTGRLQRYITSETYQILTSHPPNRNRQQLDIHRGISP